MNLVRFGMNGMSPSFSGVGFRKDAPRHAASTLSGLTDGHGETIKDTRGHDVVTWQDRRGQFVAKGQADATQLAGDRPSKPGRTEALLDAAKAYEPTAERRRKEAESRAASRAARS